MSDTNTGINKQRKSRVTVMHFFRSSPSSQSGRHFGRDSFVNWQRTWSDKLLTSLVKPLIANCIHTQTHCSQNALRRIISFSIITTPQMHAMLFKTNFFIRSITAVQFMER